MMGAHPYWYYEQFHGDVNAALQSLREREFKAGRYNPVVPFMNFPPGLDSPAPGAQHDSIGDAMDDAAEEGTRSILDLDHVADDPDFCAVAPLPKDVLQSLYGTLQPTREMVEQNMDFLENVERGQGV
jgi:hypothetical protein